MEHFISANDVENIPNLIASARECKAQPFSDRALGERKTLGLIFMNPSLRTRLSSQIAGKNLGMDVMVMNFSGEGWALETEEGVIMDGNKAEHIRDAAAVVGQYCDVIGLRSFPTLTDREKDYSEHILGFFTKYAGVPVVNLESATLHPCQSLADLLTIEEFRVKERPKVVLTWAPHPRALPQSVANSFAQWVRRMDYDFVIANPEGYDLAPVFRGDALVVHDPREAYEGADFIYSKNWSSFEDYGQILSHDPTWMVDEEKMSMTDNAKFMHCLPVRRNMIVSDAVIDSPQSIVIEEANNRTFAAQAVLKQLLGGLS